MEVVLAFLYLRSPQRHTKPGSYYSTLFVFEQGETFLADEVTLQKANKDNVAAISDIFAARKCIQAKKNKQSLQQANAYNETLYPFCSPQRHARRIQR